MGKGQQQSKKVAGCVVRRCVCQHEGQDRLHGKSMRVKNAAVGSRGVEHRCTVCGRTE